MTTIVQKSFATNALFAGLFGIGAVAWGPAGCSSPGAMDPVGGPQGGSQPQDTGSIGMKLTLPGGEQLNSVTWTITGPGGASTVVKTGMVNVANSQAVTFQVGGIPAGSGYSIALSGTTTDGATTCSGSATFSVTAQSTTTVSVVLACVVAAPDSGAALITGNTFNCGTVTSVTASPAEVNVGYAVAVTSSATGPNAGAVTYSWSSSSGSFDNPHAQNPNFTCGAAGTATLTLTVSDGSVPEGGTCSTAASTSNVQVVCDNGPLQNDVQNIVFIYAENRSFDGLFGNYPGANGLANAAASYVPQKDRDGVTVLANLPPTWNGATAAGNVGATVPQMATMGLPNLPFEIETAFNTLNDSGSYGIATSDVTRDMYHRFFENVMDINGGTNDGFAAWEDAGGLVLGHFDYSHSSLYALAQQYVVADNFFQGAFGGSFLNHQYLICGCAPSIPASVVTANGMSINVLGTPNAKGVLQLAPKSGLAASALNGTPNNLLQTGNIAPLDYFGTGDGYRAVNTMQPAYEPSGNAPATGAADLRYANPAASTTVPPQTQTTIGDLLNAQGVGWAWYAQDWNAAVPDGQLPTSPTNQRQVIYYVPPGTAKGIPDFQAHHQAFNYYAAFDPVTGAANRSAHLKDYTDMQAAITAGTLPPVAFYKPAGYQNQHPGYANVDDGDAHIVSVVNALKASPQWSHMVIVITYDEFGGQWDHVAPPQGDLIGPGTRVPAIIISPYAKAAGTVDHTQYESASILRLISHRFGLSPLPGIAARDAALVAHGAAAMGDLTNALNLP